MNASNCSQTFFNGFFCFYVYVKALSGQINQSFQTTNQVKS